MLSAIVTVNNLDEGLILAPERYDPRRAVATSGRLRVGDIAEVITEIVTPNECGQTARYVVLNTGDAKEGLIVTDQSPVSAQELGSNKKRIKEGDVIISRLRPYLRQVALVDGGLIESFGESVTLACSTEFYVLRSRGDASIAHLVPFLLSEHVQRIVAAAQEGGHHPRFGQPTLEKCILPDDLIAHRDELSAAVEQAVNQARRAHLNIRALVDKCSGMTRESSPHNETAGVES